MARSVEQKEFTNQQLSPRGHLYALFLDAQELNSLPEGNLQRKTEILASTTEHATHIFSANRWTQVQLHHTLGELGIGKPELLKTVQQLLRDNLHLLGEKAKSNQSPRIQRKIENSNGAMAKRLGI